MRFMDFLEASVRRIVAESGARRIGLAVSGGADSVALFHLLVPWCHEAGIATHVLHVNHGWRGAASDADEAFVRGLAWQGRAPCHVRRLQRDETHVRGMSPEMAARAARQRFFNEVFRAEKLDAIATAHHAGDVAETLLLRLARGAGAGGLGGLRGCKTVGGVAYLRPLLGASHAELCAWLEAHGFAWREDRTNADNTIPRNLLRNRVLPWLEAEWQPGLRRALARSAAILGDEDAFMEEAARHAFETARLPGEENALAVAKVAALPPALQRRVIRLMLMKGGGASGFDKVERVRKGLEGPDAEWRFDIPNGTVACAGGVVKFCGTAGALPPPAPTTLEIPGETTWGNLRIRATRGGGLCRENGRAGVFPARCSVSAGFVAGRPVTVRAWRDGDRMQPFGMAGHRKIQDIFTDAKVPVEQRRTIPVFVCGGEIFWLPGYRICAAAAVTGGDSFTLACGVS